MRLRLPSAIAISQAVEALRNGELVGMPTETVYGIAAVAFNRSAVLKTFEIKRRPADNPLIVHIAELNQVETVAREWPSSAARLATAFWPGPITLVVPKHPDVPNEVTAGQDTVAVRIPAHPVAQRLLRELGLPLSAPSANRFMELSPTTARDIAPEIGDQLAYVLDGGPCEVGVESTVVDCTGESAKILRPGGVSRASIEALLGESLVSPDSNSERRSPGQYPRHYSPRTRVRIAAEIDPHEQGLTFSEPQNPGQKQMPAEAAAYANELFAALHALDRAGLTEIVIQAPPSLPEWEAVWDRITKAAHSD